MFVVLSTRKSPTSRAWSSFQSRTSATIDADIASSPTTSANRVSRRITWNLRSSARSPMSWEGTRDRRSGSSPGVSHCSIPG